MTRHSLSDHVGMGTWTKTDAGLLASFDCI